MTAGKMFNSSIEYDASTFQSLITNNIFSLLHAYIRSPSNFFYDLSLFHKLLNKDFSVTWLNTISPINMFNIPNY